MAKAAYDEDITVHHEIILTGVMQRSDSYTYINEQNIIIVEVRSFL